MRIRKDLTLRQVGDDFIIVEPGQGKVDMSKVYTLNATTAWLWEQLSTKDKFSKQDIIDLLLQRYDVSESQAQKDIEKLIAVFKKNNLVEE